MLIDCVKDTSGIILLARNAECATRLSKVFADPVGKIDKKVCEVPLNLHPQSILRYMPKVRRNGPSQSRQGPFTCWRVADLHNGHLCERSQRPRTNGHDQVG